MQLNKLSLRMEPVDEELIINKAELEDFRCSICYGVFSRPVKDPCGHYFCQNCIKRWLNHNTKTCPLSRTPLLCKMLKRSPTMGRRIRGLASACPFREGGCAWQKTVGKLRNHLKRGCEYRPEACPLGCLRWVPQRKLSSHMAEECQRRNVPCANKEKGCLFRAEKRFIGRHEEEDCEFGTPKCRWPCFEHAYMRLGEGDSKGKLREFACQNERKGCGWRGDVALYLPHLRHECPFERRKNESKEKSEWSAMSSRSATLFGKRSK